MLKNFIDTQAALQTLINRAKNHDAIALDTEFVWMRTYYPQLGLIQLALSNEECYLIDPLAIDNLHSLGELLADNNIVKIFHDASQDLAILSRATDAVPKNIFDTQIAAGFAELPATLSLVNLLQHLLNIKIDKSSTRTNWLQRPLTSKQLLYAEDDVRYLRAARVLLLARIVVPEMRKWLQEELDLLNNPETYNFFDTPFRYKKIKGQRYINPKSLMILKKLTTWREMTAQRKNRPRGHIISDSMLLEVAQKQPEELTELKKETSLSSKTIEYHGTALLEIIRQAREEKSVKGEREKKRKLTPTEKATLSSLNKYILLKSDLHGLDPTLIGNSAELKELACQIARNRISSSSRQSKGWRKRFLADFLS